MKLGPLFIGPPVLRAARTPKEAIFGTRAADTSFTMGTGRLLSRVMAHQGAV
ncbi:MAG TPA: hypothetical protein VGN26_02640 [Armatimonadota bacterium]